MSANTLTGYEHEQRTPSWQLFTRLYRKGNVNLNWFVSGEGEMFNNQQPPATNNELEQEVVRVMKKYGLIEK